jgi:hypothetical protein
MDRVRIGQLLLAARSWQEGVVLLAAGKVLAGVGKMKDQAGPNRTRWDKSVPLKLLLQQGTLLTHIDRQG